MAASEVIAAGALGVAVATFVWTRIDQRRARQDRARDRTDAETRWHAELESRRPDLTVEWEWNLGKQGDWIGVAVTAKPGRPGTSIIQVGLSLDTEVTLDHLPDGRPPPKHAHAKGVVSYPISFDLHACEPGHRLRFRVTPQQPPGLAGTDTPFVPYAVDVEGTRHTGPPLAIFRRLADENWLPSSQRSTFHEMVVTYTAPPELEGEESRFTVGDG